MNKKQLKAELDKFGFKYPANATNPVLEKLLVEAKALIPPAPATFPPPVTNPLKPNSPELGEKPPAQEIPPAPVGNVVDEYIDSIGNDVKPENHNHKIQVIKKDDGLAVRIFDDVLVASPWKRLSKGEAQALIYSISGILAG